MPCYNCMHTVPHAIESVLRQTHQEFELIVIDDASSDETLIVLQQFVERDHRIKLIRNSINSRISSTQFEPRNQGLCIASGHFISYLDADNMWCPSFLEGLLLPFNDPAIKLTYCNSINYYSSTEKSAVISRDKRLLFWHGDDCTIYKTVRPDLKCLGFTQYIDTNEIMHRADVLSEIGGGWAVEHPRRPELLAAQGFIRPHRRFNDLEFTERVLETFGPSAVHHIDRTFVHFFYPSAIRNRSSVCRWPLSCEY
jgi:glycosyltransferase involved in cell wall biosynthesis